MGVIEKRQSTKDLSEPKAVPQKDKLRGKKLTVELQLTPEQAGILSRAREFVIVPGNHDFDSAVTAVDLSGHWDTGLLTMEVRPHPSSAERSINIIEETALRATEVIGDRDEALRWMGTPVRGLDYATPISVLASKEGAQRVEDIFTQLEHGVW